MNISTAIRNKTLPFLKCHSASILDGSNETNKHSRDKEEESHCRGYDEE